MTGQATDVAPETRMLQMTFDALVTARACYAAAKLRLPDFLKDGSRSSDELASATETNPNSLYRLLRCLSTIGLVNEERGQRFSLTELGATLRSDAPGGMRSWVEYFGEPYYVAAWVDILHSLKTGQAAFDHVHGKSFFGYLDDHPEQSRLFDESMTGLSTVVVAEVLAAYDFSGFHKIVDIGGGRGHLLSAILETSPDSTGVLFDLPRVIADATKLGVHPRCQLVPGDFFVALPEGGDAYIMKWILHDWDDANCARILANCRRAIMPGGKLLLVESVVPPPGVAHHSKLDDVEMLVLLGSRERTEDEYQVLLGRSGFRLKSVALTPAEFVNVIEAEPV